MKTVVRTCRTCDRIVNHSYCLIRNTMGAGNGDDSCSRWECSECGGAGLVQVMHYDRGGPTGPEVEACPRGCPERGEAERVVMGDGEGEPDAHR